MIARIFPFRGADMPRSLALLAVLLSSLGVFADAPTNEQIKQWISDLDHPRYRVRDAASLKLQQAGASVVPVLLEPAKHGNAETSDRVMKILSELADAKDEPTERAARKVLRELSTLSNNVATVAQSILDRRRNDYRVRLQAFGVIFYQQDERILQIQLEEVSETDMLTVMTLVREFPETQSLSASTKAFDDRAAKLLVNLPNLREVDFFQSSIGDEGLKTVATLRHLRRIPMGRTKVTDAGLIHLAKLTDLEYVGVRGNPITEIGLRHLKPLANLSGLNLAETKVTDASLAELKLFPNLESLFLDGTTITDAALPEVARLKSLSSVTLMKTKTTFEGRSKLKEELPRLRITDEERDYPQ